MNEYLPFLIVIVIAIIVLWPSGKKNPPNTRLLRPEELCDRRIQAGTVQAMGLESGVKVTIAGREGVFIVKSKPYRSGTTGRWYVPIRGMDSSVVINDVAKVD